MRVVVYTRVSSEEQLQGYSLDAQRRAIHQECALRGHEIVAELADEGRTARSDSLDKRPGFQTAVEMVATGQADAIAVHKLDRSARNLSILLEVMRRINGGLISVVERTDYSTPQGRFFVHMLGVLAQFYSDNLSQEVKKGQLERLRQGLYHGPLPFGLKRNPDGHGKLPPLPDMDPVLCTIADRRTWSRFEALEHIFQLAASGTSCPSIVREMHELGFPIGLSGVWHILNNRFYVGDVPVERSKKPKRFDWLPGAHEAFIDPELFERAARVRDQNRRGPAVLRRAAHAHALTGLIRCGRCGSAMHCRWRTNSQTAHIYCGQRRTKHACDQPSALQGPIEAQCLEYVRMVKPSADLADWIARQVCGEQRDTRRERAALERRARKLRDLYVWGDIDQSEYLAQKEVIERQIVLLDPQPIDQPVIAQLTCYLRNLSTAYEDALPEERNEMLRTIFSVLVIDAGRVTKVGFQPPFDRLIRASMTDSSDLPPKAGHPRETRPCTC